MSWQTRKPLSWAPKAVAARCNRHADQLLEEIAEGKVSKLMLPVAGHLRAAAKAAKQASAGA